MRYIYYSSELIELLNKFTDLYLIPFNMHVCGCLSHFNLRRCDERRVIQEKVLVVPSYFKGATINTRMRPAHELFRRSETRLW